MMVDRYRLIFQKLTGFFFSTVQPCRRYGSVRKPRRAEKKKGRKLANSPPHGIFEIHLKSEISICQRIA